MFKDQDLQNHLETSSSVKLQSMVSAEINMNISNNIDMIGNYRYRPMGSDTKYKTSINSFDPNDTGNYYTSATDSDILIDGGYKDNNSPMLFTSTKDKMKMLYSLEDCFKRFRPRSGINKLLYLNDRVIHHENQEMFNRPRYYMADKDDNFKYWTSYRQESNVEDGTSIARGIATNLVNGQYYIEDASPFIVYKEEVPTNRLVIKMQTNVGETNLGPFSSQSGSFPDPLYGESNKTTPIKWKVQVLKNKNWIDVQSFNQSSRRSDGSSIIKSDGYVELAYGLIIPDKYKDIFVFAERYSSTSFLPTKSVNGYAYLICTSESDIGEYNVWIDNQYEKFKPTYGWYLQEETVDRLTNFVTELVDPQSFISSVDNKIAYREFDKISGIRVVVDTMNKVGSTFDLIELSPRLSIDLTDKVLNYRITKQSSDLGVSGLPVGQLLASNGSLTLFDYDNAFNSNNINSIIYGHLAKNIQIKFYEIVVDVDGYDYYIPIKTLYSEAFPNYNANSREVTIDLRDLFFYLESITAPQILVTNVSISYAISLLLDNIGFSNYSFKRVSNEKDLIIPYFYVGPDKTVAQVLNDLARSTQTSMFFDEYNNFILMSKSYAMPDITERETDLTIYGSTDFDTVGLVDNKTTSSKLANIIEISSQNNKVYNDGKILYSTKYIQKSYGSIKQASMVDQNKTWIYKPVLLWEVSGSENTKAINEQVSNQSAYSLSAIPLNSDLADVVPVVSGNQVINNIMDLGEGVYWITRYNGYFYSNGEVIKYDAVQYNISGYGDVWINDTQEYRNYFAKLPFNGKIYPTGLVRIYSEPNYETINGVTKLKNGPVAKHGRGQFGTQIQKHYAGLNSYWYDNDNVRGCSMNSKYLFGKGNTVTLTEVSSEGTTFTVKDTSLVKVGQVVSITSSSSTGVLDTTGKTTVVSLVSGNDTQFVVDKQPSVALSGATIDLTTEITTVVGPAGIDNQLAQKTTRNGIIKNFLTNNYYSENEVNSFKNVQTGTIQSSAFVMNGPSFTTTETPVDFLSYVYKPLDNRFTHFGTRMRIVGKVESSDVRGQTPVGSNIYFTLNGSKPNEPVSVSGGSGGIAVMVNPETNNGYFFELVALSKDNSGLYSPTSGIKNLVFYKIKKDSTDTNPSSPKQAIPELLWSDLGRILTDSGTLTGQYRLANTTDPTVYDLGVEYEDLGSSRKFYLYINNKLVGVVEDKDPLPIYNNVALFTRGSSRCMFENIYALSNNYSQNTGFALNTKVADVYGDSEIDVNESFRKYAMSGTVQATYLSGISSFDSPKHNIYFEEFGTIMREASYFKIRYDKAFPALYAKLSPTFNKIKGYVTSGFRAGSYGAEFMVFNATDTALNLDSSSGNYLRIQGITFTQQNQNELTVDDYYSRLSDLSNPETVGSSLVSYPNKVSQEYEDIKVSRMTYGEQDFTLDTPYIQSQDDAQSLMKWLLSKITKPRKSVGIKLFAMPTIQLGDIVSINYKQGGLDIVSSPSQRYIVYNIQYEKSLNGPSMTVYLSEVA